ncbi:MAG: rhodanese-like domain-containing protein [Flavobacteriales bacterium]|nr:rhodanese-like domain-containing protein [Flavobacteriales bacterium]
MNKYSIVFSLSLAFLTISCVNSQTNSVESVESSEIIVNVDSKTFKETISSVKGILLDVRTPEEWAEGIIKGAEKIDFYDDNFSKNIEKLDKSIPVFVYCRSGGRSSEAATILKEKGFSKVYNLEGGISAWIEDGNEVVKN